MIILYKTVENKLKLTEIGFFEKTATGCIKISVLSLLVHTNSNTLITKLISNEQKGLNNHPHLPMCHPNVSICILDKF